MIRKKGIQKSRRKNYKGSKKWGKKLKKFKNKRRIITSDKDIKVPKQKRGNGEWFNRSNKKDPYKKRYYNKKNNNLAVVYNEKEQTEYLMGMFRKNVIKKKQNREYAIKMEKKMLREEKARTKRDMLRQAEEFNQIIEDHERKLDEICKITKKVEKNTMKVGESEDDEIEIITTFINKEV